MLTKAFNYFCSYTTYYAAHIKPGSASPMPFLQHTEPHVQNIKPTKIESLSKLLSSFTNGFAYVKVYFMTAVTLANVMLLRLVQNF